MTIAIDTNILVRLLFRDNPEQHKQALATAMGNQCLVLTSVFLEAEWVIRGAYGLDRKTTAGLLRAMLETRELVFDEPELATAALWAYERGMDFSDAIHLYSAEGRASALLTFDRDFVRKAGRLELALNVELPGVADDL